MRAILSYPGVMGHAQEVARALHEAGRLDAFVTGLAFRRGGLTDSIVGVLPQRIAGRLASEIDRRRITEVPADTIRAHGASEVVRTALARCGAPETLIDRAWDASAEGFDALVARRYVPRTQAIIAFEYTALESFRRAKQLGVARVLHLPSLDSRAFEAVQAREKAAWPELRQENDAYFAARFERRYARRCAEIALADVIIANSSLTKRSHVEAGADPDKIVVAPLAAEPVTTGPARPLDGPMEVVWSGSFSLRKGAHYLAEAWRLLGAGPSARLSIYGSMNIPSRVLEGMSGLELMGAVPRDQMLRAFQRADVLVFPPYPTGSAW